jgi:hypothetical protein
MIAHFYIVPESFSYSKNLSLEQIEDKVYNLSDDINLIHQYKDSNKLLANYEELYPLEFYPQCKIEDIICNPVNAKEILGRDLIVAFQKIFEKAEPTSSDIEEIKEVLLNWEEEENCHGLIAFHEIPKINKQFQIIYNTSNWMLFRRHYLGMYPKNNNYFIEECSKYFPKLFFHNRNKDSIKSILSNFAKNVILHLGYLNDVFYTYRTRHFDNESIKYKTLTTECNLEGKAASKDNNSAKEALTFDFINKKGEIELVTCYPHLRLHYSDTPGDNTFYQFRIYFHEGLPSIKDSNILIAHIGEHL